jgi:hypothetical protein
VKFFQMAVLVLTGCSVVAIIMISFTPVILFFIITAKEYFFTVFLNIGILSLAGYFATVYIIKNFKMFFENQKWLPSVLVGCFVIAFVGTQLAWTLRPFFRSYAGFTKPVSGNFYIAVSTAAAENPLIAGPLIALFILIIIMMTLFYIVSSLAEPISASRIDYSTMKSEPDGKKSKSPKLISP